MSASASVPVAAPLRMLRRLFRDHRDGGAVFRLLRRWRHDRREATVAAVEDPAAAAAACDRALRDEIAGLNDELRAVEQELARTRSEAAAALLAKGQFLATISHEIRTPLNGILPLLEMVMRSRLAPDVHEHVGTIQESARELLRIVNDVLDFSKLEANGVGFETQTFSPRSLTEGVGKLMRSIAQQRGIGFDWHVDERVRPTARGDALRVRQVLTNLVSNAIKFTERGEVSILVTLQSETRNHWNVLFTVRDTGIGISPETAGKLFKPFSQADASTTRIYGGTGLGLAISHRLVEGMGGKIGVVSRPGAGASFWFSIPLLKPIGEQSAQGEGGDHSGLLQCRDEALAQEWTRRLRAARVELRPVATTLDTLALLRTAAESGAAKAIDLVVVDAAGFRRTLHSLLRPVLREEAYRHTRVLLLGEREDIEEGMLGDPRVRLIARHAPDAAAARLMRELFGEEEAAAGEPCGPVLEVSAADDDAQAALHGLRVLLVDDLPINRHVGRIVLEKLGMQVTLASNGREALQLLEPREFDLVLMDCQMPDIDGYCATRVLRERESTLRQPRLPVIAVTANAMAGDREKCLAAGMDDYLSKPFAREALIGVIGRWHRPRVHDATATADPVPPAG